MKISGSSQNILEIGLLFCINFIIVTLTKQFIDTYNCKAEKNFLNELFLKKKTTIYRHSKLQN